ncbi:fungal-specific transcription factor domain-containing protein [Xylariaceae sp. FL0016]|nr:fungal-specific transcription factor domain-containing protein [Xylariaceae sp. FL0016]
MSFPASSERPYRSHLRPACLPCRRRKSRCKVDISNSSCLMCQVHGSDCRFPPNRPILNRRPNASSGGEPSSRLRSYADGDVLTDGRRHEIHVPDEEENLDSNNRDTIVNPQKDRSKTQYAQPTPLSIDDDAEENPHIVGPATTHDSQILTDYLSAISSNAKGMRVVRPKSSGGAASVLFTAVQKRPLGMMMNANPSHSKLQIIERLLEPWTEDLLNVYFQRVNQCLPLIDRQWFDNQHSRSKDSISPALLSCLYAHSLVYWRYDSRLAGERPPDNRFVWNLANEALFSEIHLSPGLTTITAILLNIGGRPTTSLIGNGVQLGGAISLAHSLGLNHDPSSWDIMKSEQLLRMQIWWALLIHDRWSSLAHGTPPHIQSAFHDVPLPNREHLVNQPESQRESGASSVYFALCGLTDVLDCNLQYLYRINKQAGGSARNLEFRLNKWTDRTRKHLPGAANLRLAYLSVQLLTHRIQLEEDRAKGDVDEENVANCYMRVRRTAEDIMLLVQELQEEQLGDFWLPMAAFVFPSTVTFLLRCALETEDSTQGLAQSMSVRLAWDLIVALRRHRETSNWDLGDICLAQHSEVVERLMMPLQTDRTGDETIIPDFQDIAIPDASFIDELFPSIWDTFRNNTP